MSRQDRAIPSPLPADRQTTPRPALGIFERYLTLWVALCIVAGIALGNWLPAPFQALGGLEVARVNLPVAVLIWLMIIPMLMKIDFAALSRVWEYWRGIGVTLFINWGVKPFSMALLGWLLPSRPDRTASIPPTIGNSSSPWSRRCRPAFTG